MTVRILITLLLPALLAGCGGEDPAELTGPLATPSPVLTEVPRYDATAEPTEAVMSLVPLSATTVTVTDFDEIRVQLGVPDLTSEDPMADRTAFWERAATDAPLLTDGMLRADNSEFMLDYGFTQDDVDWEAHWTGPEGNGFALAFRPDQDMAAVRRAVAKGAGPLDGAAVQPDQHLVVAGTAVEGQAVWGADPGWRSLVGEPATATYLRQGCIPVAEALGPDATAEDLDVLLDRNDVRYLDDLAGFALGFGDHNATVRMAPSRDDLFDRLEVGQGWPVAGFPDEFRRGVGDPASGRIGYDVPRPPRAAALALGDELPFGVCNEFEPIPEPTG